MTVHLSYVQDPYEILPEEVFLDVLKHLGHGVVSAGCVSSKWRSLSRTRHVWDNCWKEVKPHHFGHWTAVPADYHSAIIKECTFEELTSGPDLEQAAVKWHRLCILRFPPSWNMKKKPPQSWKNHLLQLAANGVSDVIDGSSRRRVVMVDNTGHIFPSFLSIPSGDPRSNPDWEDHLMENVSKLTGHAANVSVSILKTADLQIRAIVLLSDVPTKEGVSPNVTRLLRYHEMSRQTLREEDILSWSAYGTALFLGVDLNFRFVDLAGIDFCHFFKKHFQQE